jgi:hypothetical protein
MEGAKMSLADVDQITLRTSRYWMEDGLVEIMMGALFLFLGGGTLVRMALPRELTWDLLASALTIVGALGLRWGFQKAKEKITFPRGGYVSLLEPTRKSRLSVRVTFAILALISGSLPFVRFNDLRVQLAETAVPFAALIFASTLAWPGFQLRLRRVVFEALLCLMFGAALYAAGLKGSKGVMTLMSMIGFCMICLGAVALSRFLKTPPQQPEE